MTDDARGTGGRPALDGGRSPTGRAVPGTAEEHAMAMAFRGWLLELRAAGRHPDLHMEERWTAMTVLERAIWLRRARERMATEAATPIGEPRILAVAVIHGGRVYGFPSPGRHHDAIRKVARLDPDAGRGLCPPKAQGFVLEDGTYVGREEGARIALASGQVERLHTEGRLFSEDLW